MDPTYFISYVFGGANGMRGDGSMPDFKPMFEGKPSILLPAHMPLIVSLVKEELVNAGIIAPTVTVMCVWRYEDEGR